MEILQKNRKTTGIFIAEENGMEVGRLTYSWDGNERIIINHTEVNKNFQGQNIGKKLILAAVAYAQKSQAKIVPTCPFSRSVIEKIDKIKDIII